MRLLLDEHLSPEIARQLRNRGHDVIAVGERDDLRGRSDRIHFAAAPDERRVIVTRDVADFRPLIADALRGLVYVPRRYALSRQGIGALVGALDALLKSHPGDDAVIRRGGEIWLD